uniref:Glycoprotein R8.1 n=1 Tax=Macaca mulatta rhadinovirus TaxID=703611 RepID=D2XQU3_9GAMA|nr:glycoprotein R8.1 [Macaca mulatta rhadinovirus]ADB08374.1 glycoprotein R8.1 [Macaca mulatta rhadinovirus]
MGFGNIRLGWGLCFMVWVAWIARGRSVCPTWHLTDGKYEAVYRHYLEECRKHEGSGSLDGSGQTKRSGTKATTEANISIRPNVVTSGQNKEPPGTAPRAESSHDLPRIKQVNALRLSTPELAQPLPVVKSTPRESQSEPSVRGPHAIPSSPFAIGTRSRPAIVPLAALPSFKPDPRLTVRVYPLRPERWQDTPSREQYATKIDRKEYHAVRSTQCPYGRCTGPQASVSDPFLPPPTPWHLVHPLWAMAGILGLTIALYTIYQIYAHRNYTTLHCE